MSYIEFIPGNIKCYLFNNLWSLHQLQLTTGHPNTFLFISTQPPNIDEEFCYTMELPVLHGDTLLSISGSFKSGQPTLKAITF